jgi:hypothetical protein
VVKVRYILWMEFSRFNKKITSRDKDIENPFLVLPF